MPEPLGQLENVMADLTQSRLKELLDYDPETGLFTRRVARGNQRAGDTAGTLIKGYIAILIDRKPYYAHRLAWFYVYGEWPKDEIDHINRRKADNQIANLREADRSQNMGNQKPSSLSKSGLKGANWRSDTGRWRAKIKLHGRNHYLGYFSTPEEAHATYVKKAQEIFGEFARAE